MPLVGYYPVDERWDLYTGSELRSHHVAVVELRPKGRGYEARHYGPGGELITSSSVDHSSAEEIVREYQRVDSLRAALDMVRDMNKYPPKDFDFGGGL